MSSLESLVGAIPLAEALRDWFPRGRKGTPVHLSTGLRWVKKGVKAANGKTVLLRAVRFGGSFYVRRAECDDFIIALNDCSAQ